jgi:SWI/SNF-related matrix-associated actin-dependent regulator of chromatin subfamily A-like protein 1
MSDIGITLRTPPDLEPLPFQKAGILEILLRKNVLLGDEMGLGKTIQLIVSMNYARPGKVLVCCPKSLTWNWYYEIQKWSEGVESWELDELETIGNVSYIDVSRRLTIVSYEVIARNFKILASQQWDWIIFDEFHYLKNSGSKRAKGVREFLDSQIRRDELGNVIGQPKIIGATGSPIVNYVHELFPLIHILDPQTWWSQAAFDRRYTMRNRSGIRAYGRNQAELQQKLRETIMIRRTKKEVLPDLPKKRRQVIEFPSEGLDELLQEEMRLFQGRNRSDNADAVADMILEINASGVVEGETNWEEIISNMKYTRSYFFEEMARIRHLVAQAKLPQVLEHISGVLESFENGEKLVIIAHHRDIIEDMTKFINKWYEENRGISEACKSIMGGMSDREKHQIINVDFQGSDLPRVIVGGIKVVGHGYTMVRAHQMLFVELDWTPSNVDQAEARIHRIGQDQPVLYQHLTLKNSLDAAMAKKVVAKLRQQDKVLNRQ